NVYGGELIMAEESESDDILFRSGEHFREEVESKTDSVWLIKVIPPGRRGLLPPNSWKTVKRKVSYFGIRTGIFKCTLDLRFCLEKKWIKPSILLAMETSKDYVTMFHHYKPSQPAYILDWINIHLKLKITILSNHGAARKWMESAERFSKYIHVAYYSKIDQLPLFYSSLGVKFAGRIKFAFMSTNPMELSTMERSQNDTLKVPSILVITPEGTLLYGKCPGEFVSYAGLGLYLSTLSLDLTDSDAAIWSFIVVNVICFFEFCITQGGIFKRIICTIKLILISNFFLYVFWISVLFLEVLFLSILEAFWYFANNLLETLQLSLLEMFREIHHKFVISNIMCYIRHDILVYSNNIKFLLFITYCFIIGLIEKFLMRSTVVPQESIAAARPPGATHRNNARMEEAVPEIEGDRRTATQPVNLHHLINLRHLMNLHQVYLAINRVVGESRDQLIDEFIVNMVLETDYISELKRWKYCSMNVRDCHQSLGMLCGPREQMNVELNADTLGTINEFQPNVSQEQRELFKRFISTECVICQYDYYHGELICGLPCGHSYHDGCILIWLRGDHHRCPSCRKPAYSQGNFLWFWRTPLFHW
ncbi:E3 ubiquitin-protein ligase RNF103-like, partial [Anneissia japonica]|uniref:E3 ubiquitin-protein ligase RNF103-like n=1 Tax=Anneissia japonica TaxID=1529436 RepID=UPI001425AE6A